MQPQPALALAALVLAAPGFAARAGGTGGSATQLRRSHKLRQPAEYWDYSDNGASWKMGECGAASGQSPIDLSMASIQEGSSSDVLFDSYAVLENPMTMRNDGRVLVMQLPGGVGGISLGAETWDAYQMVVHVPSEHTFGGSRVGLELQIYHGKTGSTTTPGQAPPANSIAVVSVGFVASVEASPFLDSMRQGGLPNQAGAERMVNKQAPAKLDFGSLFVGATFLQYTGSLTTPPCSPGVQWFVRSAPLPAGLVALDDFKSAVSAVASLHQAAPGNARSLQPGAGVSAIARSTQAVAHPGLPQGGLVDPEFDKAVVEAAGQQESFENSLPSGGQVSPQDTEYQGCVQELVQADGALKSAEAQRKVECQGLEKAKEQLENAGAGVTRLQALDRLHAQEQLCNANTKVASRLRAEARILQRQCQRVKPSL